jgi:hypothetical protein
VSPEGLDKVDPAGSAGGGSTQVIEYVCRRIVDVKEPSLSAISSSPIAEAIRLGALNVRAALHRGHSDAGLRRGPLAANGVLARLPQSARSGRLPIAAL